MAKYRKKPVVIEAQQWNPFREGRHWSPMPPAPCRVLRERASWIDLLAGRMVHWEILTPEGWVNLSPGDYVCCGVRDDWYPCKPDIFEATYEPADELDASNWPHPTTQQQQKET